MSDTKATVANAIIDSLVYFDHCRAQFRLRVNGRPFIATFTGEAFSALRREGFDVPAGQGVWSTPFIAFEMGDRLYRVSGDGTFRDGGTVITSISKLTWTNR
jgi:hypothetical protein